MLSDAITCGTEYCCLYEAVKEHRFAVAARPRARRQYGSIPWRKVQQRTEKRGEVVNSETFSSTGRGIVERRRSQLDV